MYFTLGLGLLVMVTLIVFIYLNLEKTFTGYKVVASSERSDSSTKGYIKYQEDKIIRYSCDGIELMDRDEKSLWNSSYSMKNPKVVTCENYIAVADIGSKSICVYNENGDANEIENVLDVSQIAVSRNGIVAAVLEDGMANYIRVMDKKKTYIDVKTRIKEDGYPIDIAFSQDSQKLVTSYVSTKDIDCTNYVTFYNFGEVGKNYESKIVKAESYSDTMVPRIEFLDEDTVCTFLDNQFIVYEMKEVPKEKYKSEKFDKKIKSIFYDKKRIGIVLDNDKKYTIKVYTVDGDEVLNKDIEYNYDNIYLSGDDIVMYTKNDAKILRMSGREKLNCMFDGDVEFMLPYNNSDKYIIVTNNLIRRVKLSD